MVYICQGCAKQTDFGDLRGSIRYPLCSKCFKLKFDNNHEKFWKFMQENDITLGKEGKK